MGSIPGPTALISGVSGAARIINGPRLGAITAWRLVISPTTGRRTLIAEGRFLRYYAETGVGRVEVEALPSAPPVRIGRPKPRSVRPVRIVGSVAELNTRALVVTEDAPL